MAERTPRIKAALASYQRACKDDATRSGVQLDPRTDLRIRDPRTDPRTDPRIVAADRLATAVTEELLPILADLKRYHERYLDCCRIKDKMSEAYGDLEHVAREAYFHLNQGRGDDAQDAPAVRALGVALGLCTPEAKQEVSCHE